MRKRPGKTDTAAALNAGQKKQPLAPGQSSLLYTSREKRSTDRTTDRWGVGHLAPHSRHDPGISLRLIRIDHQQKAFTQCMRSSAPNALKGLRDATREFEAALDEIRGEHDPLALHIFTSRRRDRATQDTKSGKRHDLSARLSWERACEHGFRGSLGEWNRLMSAVAKG